MNFFIPLDGDPSLAESLWRLARELLDETGFPTEDRRFHSLYFSRGDEVRVAQVGVEEEGSGEPVLLIFRAADTPFYWVCTMLNGIVDGVPMPVPASEVVCAVAFEP